MSFVVFASVDGAFTALKSSYFTMCICKKYANTVDERQTGKKWKEYTEIVYENMPAMTKLFSANPFFHLLTMRLDNGMQHNVQYPHLAVTTLVMVYDMCNNDIHISIVHVLCVIAACCRSVHISHCDIQRFLCRWFAWSLTLLMSLPFTQRAVVKAVTTSHLNDWTSIATRQIKLGNKCNVFDVTQLPK